jgi:hypothetical protein
MVVISPVIDFSCDSGFWQNGRDSSRPYKVEFCGDGILAIRRPNYY